MSILDSTLDALRIVDGVGGARELSLFPSRRQLAGRTVVDRRRFADWEQSPACWVAPGLLLSTVKRTLSSTGFGTPSCPVAGQASITPTARISRRSAEGFCQYTGPVPGRTCHGSIRQFGRVAGRGCRHSAWSHIQRCKARSCRKEGEVVLRLEEIGSRAVFGRATVWRIKHGRPGVGSLIAWRELDADLQGPLRGISDHVRGETEAREAERRVYRATPGPKRSPSVGRPACLAPDCACR